MFTKAQIDEGTRKSREGYEKLRDDPACDAYDRMYYDLCARIQPEISRWAIEQVNAHADRDDIGNACSNALCGALISTALNLAQGDQEGMRYNVEQMLRVMIANAEGQMTRAKVVGTIRKTDS